MFAGPGKVMIWLIIFVPFFLSTETHREDRDTNMCSVAIIPL